MQQQYHVISLVIHTIQQQTQPIIQQLTQLAGLELHSHDQDGKLIVTIEGEHSNHLLDHIETINQYQGVISSSLIYHHVESI